MVRHINTQDDCHLNCRLYTLIYRTKHIVATEENQQKVYPKKTWPIANNASLVPGLAFANGSKMKLGLVTYQWGKDLGYFPRSSKIALAAKIYGVELRVEHCPRSGACDF